PASFLICAPPREEGHRGLPLRVRSEELEASKSFPLYPHNQKSPPISNTSGSANRRHRVTVVATNASVAIAAGQMTEVQRNPEIKTEPSLSISGGLNGGARQRLSTSRPR